MVYGVFVQYLIANAATLNTGTILWPGLRLYPRDAAPGRQPLPARLAARRHPDAGRAMRWERLTRGGRPLALSDDDLDFYGHDHQHRRQEVKMLHLHLFLQVEAGGEIPPASSFWR
jgi:hypothetical protein